MKNFHWKESVIYHIYPRSFQDSDGDGIGDLNGITSRLDYLKSDNDDSLQVDAIWISPFYPSPMKDGGYDISDFCSIDSVFGSLEDFDTLLSEAHKRDLKVIIDYVPNHCSSEHSWFQESRSSLNNPKRNWFIWRDAKPSGGPPNNWLSMFGGSAWEKDELTGQYFLHSFDKTQPDLNWDNPEVKQAMFDVVRFWLKRGVDGIRVDAFAHVLKDESFPDEPKNPSYIEGREDPYYSLLHTYSKDVAGKMNILRELCKVVDEFDHKLIVTEAILELEDLLQYYHIGQKETLSPFNFFMLKKPWNVSFYETFLRSYEKGRRPRDIGNFVLSNHDNPRVIARIGREAARVAAVLLFSLRGIPFVYYGDEIGMDDGEIVPLDVRDPKELNNPGKGLGRDPARTPMQWSTEKNAGFSTGTSWLPVNKDYEAYNVEIEKQDKYSFLSLYRTLIKARKSYKTLRTGTYTPLIVNQDEVLVFLREDDEAKLLIILNFSGEAKELSFPFEEGEVVCHAKGGDEGNVLSLSNLHLQGNDAYILKLS